LPRLLSLPECARVCQTSKPGQFCRRVSLQFFPHSLALAWTQCELTHIQATTQVSQKMKMKSGSASVLCSRPETRAIGTGEALTLNLSVTLPGCACGVYHYFTLGGVYIAAALCNAAAGPLCNPRGLPGVYSKRRLWALAAHELHMGGSGRGFATH
jgi:hypothetical protein